MNKISVIIPAYNAEKYISKAIKSVLNQVIFVHEIIVVDDCSTDGTSDVVKKLIEEQSIIKLFKQEMNQGVSSARNRGIQEADCDWILFLDADDECAPSLLKYYKEEIECHSSREKVSMIYTAYQQINEQSQIISEVVRGKRLSGNEGFCDILMRNPIISPSGVLVKREVLKEGFKTSLSFNEDIDLWVRLLNDNHIIEYIDTPLSFIRRHSSNTTSSMSVSHQAEKTILNQYGLDTIKEKLFSRDFSLEKKSLDYALFLIRYEEWDPCMNLLESLTVQQESSQYVTYCFLRSLCFVHDRKFEAALEQYKKILTIHPEHGASLNNAGVIYSLRGMKEQAIENIKRALLNSPDYLDAKHNLKLTESGNDDASMYRFTLRELRPVLLSYSTD